MQHEVESEAGMVVDCNTCAMRGTDACDDCVVAFVLDRGADAVVFDAAEERAVRAMSKAGLLPLLRWQKRTG
jgi:hypothetical protein